jgi:hypothetical protein
MTPNNQWKLAAQENTYIHSIMGWCPFLLQIYNVYHAHTVKFWISQWDNSSR